jgi:hypothetical protein
MVKRLTKHGNSPALVIDRPILNRLKIDPETPLDVSTHGERADRRAGEAIRGPVAVREGGEDSARAPRTGIQALG